MTPISASTTITMGNASTGTAPTILEVPASQSGNNDFTTLSCPLVLSAAAPNSGSHHSLRGWTFRARSVDQ